MLILYVLIGVFVLSLIIAIIVAVCDNSYCDLDWLLALNGVVALISFCVGVILGFTLINIDKKFDAFVNRYNFTKELVINYEPNDYGNKAALLLEVIEINDNIAEHKAFAGNVWTGAWYSEKIAELEPIYFNNTQKVEEDNVI